MMLFVSVAPPPDESTPRRLDDQRLGWRTVRRFATKTATATAARSTTSPSTTKPKIWTGGIAFEDGDGGGAAPTVGSTATAYDPVAST